MLRRLRREHARERLLGVRLWEAAVGRRDARVGRAAHAARPARRGGLGRVVLRLRGLRRHVARQRLPRIFVFDQRVGARPRALGPRAVAAPLPRGGGLPGLAVRLRRLRRLVPKRLPRVQLRDRAARGPNAFEMHRTAFRDRGDAAGARRGYSEGANEADDDRRPPTDREERLAGWCGSTVFAGRDRGDAAARDVDIPRGADKDQWTPRR